MKVSSINSFFAKIGRFQIKYRIPILIAFLAVTAFCCVGLKDFALKNSDEGWYGNKDKLKVNKDLYESNFGNSSSASILLTAEDVFSEEILNVIDRLGQRMLTEIPYANKLTSLIELEIPVGNEEGFEIVKPYEYGIPSDKKELEQKRALILRGTEETNACKNVLVSDDGKETWISLSLLPFKNSDEDALEVGYKLNDILESEEFKSDAYKLYGCGQPYFDVQEEIYEYPDFTIRIALSFVVMILFLTVFIRSVPGVLIPSAATVGAIASVLGLMSYFGEKAESSLVTLPILLGIALSVGYSIHFINMFKLHFRKTGDRKLSAVKTVEESGWSVFFTVLTTTASLISFIFVDMKPLAWMGRTASLIVIAVYIYVAILIPICLSLGKNKSPEQINSKADKAKRFSNIDLKFQKWADTAKKHRRLIIIIAAIIFGACVPFIFKISARVDIIQMTGLNMPHMKKMDELLSKKLGNQYSYSVMISYDDYEAFKNPEHMKALEDFEKFLGTLSLTKKSGNKARVSSVTDILKEMYRAFNEGQDEYYILPEDEYILAQLMELSSIDMAKDFETVMDSDFRIANIDVDMSSFETEAAVEDMAKINQKLKELFPDANSCIIGDMIEYAEMCRRMVRGELKSFMFSFIIVAIMLIIAFSSVRTGLIAMIPNLAPVVLIGGLMGLLKFQLDFVTMTVMPLILGIAVDDTIHLTTHLKLGLERYGNYKLAMEASLREIGKSMFLTTFILCSIFAVYLFSPIRYLKVIGILSITGLAGALIADYTITPALLYIIKPFGKESNPENSETNTTEE